MHEFFVATEIVNTVLHSIEGHKVKKVLNIELEVGELTSVNPEQLKFCFDAATKETSLEGSELNIIKKAASIKCNSCSYRGTLKTPQIHLWRIDFICPKCESFGIEILSGNELTVKNIKIEEENGE
ncbi:MAG: hydrogenase maturation nickel metallochaperone HypA [Candidatus Hydrothermarchaeales archaeon]